MDENTRLNRWNALVEGFKSFGGTAENLIQREGALGLGLFPIDASKPVELRVPDNLLVSTDNLEVIDSNVVLKDESSYPKGFGEWYSNFQAEYSWGAEARKSIKAFEEGLRNLPESLLRKLQSLGLINIKQRLTEPNDDQASFQRFIATRQLYRNGNRVLMPMIELVNHSPLQSSWIMDKESIAIKGKYDNEILVRYSVSDPLHRYIQYGFNCKEPMGFSLRFQLIHNNQKIIIDGGINFEPTKTHPTSRRNESIVLHKPLLSSYKRPRMPRSLFGEHIKFHPNINANELFEQIHLKNRIIVIDLVKDLQNINNNAARQLETACLNQIEILSEHI